MNGGCFPNINQSQAISGGVQTLTIEYKPFTPDDPNNNNTQLLWGSLLAPSSVPSGATVSLPTDILPP